jgi:meso-butanediol dehydrogenase/(S,S)-butanediol dehydrogenase/diacetyl reductase
MMEKGVALSLQTASTNGLVGHPYYADYNAAKGGVIELTKSMALELAPKIPVDSIAPVQRAEYTDQMLDEVNQQIPMRRHAKPEEIAALFFSRL